MKLHYKVLYSVKDLVDFINDNGIKREDIQILEKGYHSFELWYWSND